MTRTQEDILKDCNNDSRVFAYLKPVTDHVKSAYCETMNMILEDFDKHSHHAKFLFTERFVTPDDNKSKISILASQQTRWKGRFKLSLDSPPRDFGKGWLLGTGLASDGSREEDVDILQLILLTIHEGLQLIWMGQFMELKLSIRMLEPCPMSPRRSWHSRSVFMREILRTSLVRTTGALIFSP